MFICIQVKNNHTKVEVNNLQITACNIILPFVFELNWNALANTFISIVGYESFLWTSKWNLYYHSHEISTFAEKKPKKWWTCWTGETKRELTGPTHTPTFTIPLYSVCFRGIWYVIFNSIFMICRYHYKILTLIYLLI